MGFKFGFEDEDVVKENNKQNTIDFMNQVGLVEQGHEPKLFPINQMLKPGIISFGRTDGLLRREVFDVRHELMQKDNLTAEEEILMGNTNEDIRINQYEGGLKIWECSFDLVQVLRDGGNIESNKCIELGCGAALPSIFILQKALKNNNKLKLTLADYNQSVLELVTAPNMFLAWYDIAKGITNENELDITQEMLNEFYSELENRGIELDFISGSWSPEFINTANTKYDLVLASETIYSKDKMSIFTDTMIHLLNSDNGNSQSLVAAKKMYFGVGGNIPDFITLLDERNVKSEMIFDKPSGIGRAVLKITL